MKEQWRKHESDAKLLLNVEEGTPQPIKIELPISAFQLKQDGCCNRLITFLRVAVLFVLLLILCWTAVTLYSNYYPRQLVTDEKTEQLVGNQHDFNSEENKASFRNKVYRMFDDHDAVRNEIDTTSAPESVAKSELPVDKVVFKLEDMRYLPPMIKMKNLDGIRIIDVPPNQENKNENELHNMNSESVETKLHDYIFKERLNLENFPESESVNEDDISAADQQTYVKLVNIPLEIPQDDYFAKRFNLEVEPEPKSEVPIIKVTLTNSPDKELASDKEDSMEGFKNINKSAEESDRNEIVTIPNLEVENAQQSGEDLTNYMEPIEVDDMDQLLSEIATLMGLYKEASSEVNNSSEESAAVIQEEIKNNEEKVDIVDLENVSNVEEKSQEQSVAVIQEEIKDDNDNLPTTYLEWGLEPSSEAEDPDVEAAAVVQEEIKNEPDKIIDTVMPPFRIHFVIDKNFPNPWISNEDDPSEKSQEKTSLEETSIDDLDKNISQEGIKSESGESINPAMPPHGIDYVNMFDNPYVDTWRPNEDDPAEKSQENTSLEETSIDDLDKNISQDESSIEGKLREILSISESMKSPQLPLKPVTKRDYTVTLAKLLVPFVGDDYELAHWYHSVFLGPLSPDDDKKKMYAAKMLYSDKISEFDSDVEMWLNEILEDPYIAEFSDIINPQKQIETDTFLENQIADKILEKIQLKSQYDVNMINLTQAADSIALSNSNHLKSWFLATHPSLRYREPIRSIVVMSMDARRKLYPIIKNDFSHVRNDLSNENKDLEMIRFDYYDFNVEPMISTLEVYPLHHTADVLKTLVQKKKDLPYSENVSPVEKYHLIRIQQAIIESQKIKLEIADDYSEESNSRQQSIIEAMKQVAEEYEQTEKSSEETTTSLVEDHTKIEQSEDETNASTIKNDDEENVDFTEEISPDPNQFESSNTNLNPIEEEPFQTESDEQFNEAAENSRNSNQFDSSNTNLNPIEEEPFQTESDEQFNEAAENSRNSNQFDSSNTNLNPIEEVPFRTESDEKFNEAEEISPDSNQFDSSNTNLNPIEEVPIQTESDGQFNEAENSRNSNQYDSSNTNLNPIEEVPIQTESDEQFNEAEFLRWLQEQGIHYKPEENEEEQSLYSPYDPFDY